jgi:hypothetical protein
VGFSSHWRIGCCWVNSISLHQNLCLVLVSVICCWFCVFQVCFTTADVDSSHSGHVKKKLISHASSLLTIFVPHFQISKTLL